MKGVTVKLALPDAQALALAQFVKRVGWTEIRANAADNYEADLMRDAIAHLQRQLAEAGYAPR